MENDITQLMLQCDSIYIDQMASGEWRVEALLNCEPSMSFHNALDKAITLACQGAIEANMGTD